MSLSSRPAIFGSPRRTEILILIALLEESYPREISRLLRAPLLSVQKIIDALEVEGVLVTRLMGNQRRVTLNPRYYGAKQLRELLLRLADGYANWHRPVRAHRRAHGGALRARQRGSALPHRTRAVRRHQRDDLRNWNCESGARGQRRYTALAHGRHPLYVDHKSPARKGQVLARLDPTSSRGLAT
jgi:DNA-binding transcriptional ArsR family regulator